MMTQKFHVLSMVFFLLLVVLFAGCTNVCIKQLDSEAMRVDSESVRENNRGVALMGQFDFISANKVFTDLNKKYPENIILQINQAISILNRQGPDDEQLALDILNRVLAQDETNINAQYCSGLLELHMGRLEKALNYFLNVLEADPADPEVMYFIGKTFAQLSRYDEALKYFDKSLKIDQYISSSYYSIIMVMRQLGKRDEALSMIKEYQKFKNNPRARILDFKYTKMGRKAEAIAINIDNIQQNKKPEGPIFNEPENITVSNQKDSDVIIGNEIVPENYGITICDINNDSYLDLFMPGAFIGNNNVHNTILLGTKSIKNYKLASSHPLVGIENVNTALWGDINDDGLVDVYLCRRGENQLWLQNKNGKWENATKVSLTGGGDFNTVDGALFDADHDGDLDIFLVNFDGPNELLNNNRDSTFRPLAKEYGLAGKNIMSRSIVLKDFDNDRDVDIIIINDNPPHEVYINQRLWKYEPAKGFDDFIKSDIKSIAAGDLNSDGNWEIYTLDADYSLSIWVLNQDHKWQKKYLYNEPGSDLIKEDKRFFMLALSDYDGDGNIDILKTDHHGWKILSFEKEKLKILSSYQKKNNAPFLSLGEISTQKGPGIIGLSSGKNLEIWMPGSGRFLFCNVSLSGRQDPDNSIRTNSSGIGTKLSIRNGSQWTVMDTFRNHSGPGQGYQPLSIGLNISEKPDFIKVEWPDGIFQTEIDFNHQKINKIVETQRQMSSCPVLFAWNGTKFEFVSDILGVGGIGYAVGPGIYAEPRPWENFMFPKDFLKPDNDRLMIKLAEPMEEVEYLDAVKLKAYDLPPGWSMTMDERMGINAPFPTGEAIFYEKAVLPVKAVNDRRENVTQYILKKDFRACPPGNIDSRFIGRLEKDHILTLIFSEEIKINPKDPILVIDGWVEYPYSQTSFAAWQANAEYKAPTIEFEGPDGQWRILLEQFGYPAGMPRQMSVPLKNIPKGVKKIRITTNQEIYWDKIVIAYPEMCQNVKINELDFKKAYLEQVGFPERIDFKQHRPYYNFSNRAPVWDTNLQEGFYTKLGDVLELVQNKDNAIAILGPGESIHMEFETVPGIKKPGWNRIYVIETHGWCKDMDLYTNTGETVAPIPSDGDPGKIAKRLNTKYNTRYLSGRL